jgi:hypothetical protein
MTFSDGSALAWVEKLIAIAVILQTLELLALRKTISNEGVWRWDSLREDFAIFPTPIRVAFASVLRYPNFIFLLLARLVCAVLLLSFPFFGPLSYLIFWPIFGLLLGTTLISWRWRGSVNGGSDFMTLIILMALGVATLFKNDPKVGIGCLWYISLQTCTSYFNAGWVKARRPNWRTGKAVAGFLNSTIYESYNLGPSLLSVASHPSLRVFASWSVITFECAFPLALTGPHASLAFIGAALVFHLVNAYIFGLNRFLFAWGAAYPALYYCSQYR